MSSKLKLERQEVLERRGKSAEKMANQGGKSKNMGICHGLALLSGRCTAEAMAKGQEFGTGEVAALLLKFTGCYLQKAQSKT